MVFAASGPFRPAAPQDVEPADWQASFDVLARGFFTVACAAHERFLASSSSSTRATPATSRGVIVAITDLLATVPYAAFAAHGAAKAAQVMLVRSLAKAWAPDGVRVCGVAPGPVDLPDDRRRDATVRAAERLTSGRLIAPAEIAAAVRFLIDDDGVTGVDLPVDGGALLS